jgi:DNA-directed RNA polymerase specialized sigma24 family protein
VPSFVCFRTHGDREAPIDIHLLAEETSEGWYPPGITKPRSRTGIIPPDDVEKHTFTLRSLVIGLHVSEPHAMSSDDPVTLWIDELRNADEAAAQKLWNHFVHRLYELGRKRLRPATRRVYDEEDAAQSAFHSVCVGIAAGRYPDLRDRNGLWRLMLTITARKVGHRHRHDEQERRDVRRTFSDSIFLPSSDASGGAGTLGIASREPTPEFAAEFVETCNTLFNSLDDPTLQQVVTLRMDGHSDAEIADRLKCSRRTVQRRVEVIRRHWDRLELSVD